MRIFKKFPIHHFFLTISFCLFCFTIGNYIKCNELENNNGEKEKSNDTVQHIIEELHFLERVQDFLEKDNLEVSDAKAENIALDPDEDVPKEELEKIKLQEYHPIENEQVANLSSNANEGIPLEKNFAKKKKKLSLIISENHDTTPSFFQQSFLESTTISFIESKGTLTNLKSLNTLVIDLKENIEDEELKDYIQYLESKGALVEPDQLIGADSINLDAFKEAVIKGDPNIDPKKYDEAFLEEKLESKSEQLHQTEQPEELYENDNENDNENDSENDSENDNENDSENDNDDIFLFEIEADGNDTYKKKTQKDKVHKKKAIETKKKPNHRFNDEFRNLLWALDLTRFDDIVDLVDRNRVKETKICVIDSGIDYNHPDLKDNIAINKKELHGKDHVDDDNNGIVDDVYGVDYFNNDSDPMDDNYHGTHVAGIIAAVGNNGIGVVGIDPRSKLIICKALDENKLGRIGDMLKCFDYCIKRGANIINGSISFDKNSNVFNYVVKALNDFGILFVVSASNCSHSFNLEPDLSKCDLSINARYPSNLSVMYDNVLTVANMKIDADNLVSLSINSFYSNIYCQVAAPGTNIYSTAPMGTYKKLNGTSMAAPHVVGIASLIYSINPNLSYKQILYILEKSVTPVDSLKEKTKWGGYINIGKAINLTLESTSNKNSVNVNKNWKTMKRPKTP